MRYRIYREWGVWWVADRDGRLVDVATTWAEAMRGVNALRPPEPTC